MLETPQISIQHRASLLRRIAAMLYDSMLLIGLYFVATALVLPLNNGEAFSQNHYGFQLYLLLLSFVFFAWFWTHGGQTPGMKAWRLKLEPMTLSNGQTINWRVSAKRFLFGLVSAMCLGLGFIVILFSSKRLAWHDRWSQTHMLYLKKPAKNST